MVFFRGVADRGTGPEWISSDPIEVSPEYWSGEANVCGLRAVVSPSLHKSGWTPASASPKLLIPFERPALSEQSEPKGRDVRVVEGARLENAQATSDGAPLIALIAHRGNRLVLAIKTAVGVRKPQ